MKRLMQFSNQIKKNYELNVFANKIFNARGLWLKYDFQRIYMIFIVCSI